MFKHTHRSAGPCCNTKIPQDMENFFLQQCKLQKCEFVKGWWALGWCEIGVIRIQLLLPWSISGQFRRNELLQLLLHAMPQWCRTGCHQMPESNEHLTACRGGWCRCGPHSALPSQSRVQVQGVRKKVSGSNSLFPLKMSVDECPQKFVCRHVDAGKKDVFFTVS